MDLDSFAAVREGRWQRLKELSGRKNLSGAEADEFARLYQHTATDLSTVRSAAPDPALVSRLSVLLAGSRAALTGAREPAWREALRYIALGLPASLYRIRWWTVGVMIFFLIVSAATAAHFMINPEALDALGSQEERRQYAEEAFAQYYSENPSTSFFARVWTNNAFVAALCILLSPTGIFPLYLQYSNAVAVGSAAAVMDEFGYLGLFFQLIMPHGLLELTAVWVAGGAAFKLFWSMFVPGPRPRLQAVAEEGRAMFGVALGLVGVLFVSGIIEGYVTGSSLLWPVKIAIGVVALAAFWAYVLVLGGRAYRIGHTGDVSEEGREAVGIYAG
jgi:uncharacterized membrane protein SpoIIM required for sporulation